MCPHLGMAWHSSGQPAPSDLLRRSHPPSPTHPPSTFALAGDAGRAQRGARRRRRGPALLVRLPGLVRLGRERHLPHGPQPGPVRSVGRGWAAGVGWGGIVAYPACPLPAARWSPSALCSQPPSPHPCSTPPPCSTTPAGENLYWGSNASTCKVAVDAWMREASSRGGHYTQVGAGCWGRTRGDAACHTGSAPLSPQPLPPAELDRHLRPAASLQIVYPASTQVGCAIASCGMVTCSCERAWWALGGEWDVAVLWACLPHLSTTPPCEACALTTTPPLLPPCRRRDPGLTRQVSSGAPACHRLRYQTARRPQLPNGL